MTEDVSMHIVWLFFVCCIYCVSCDACERILSDWADYSDAEELFVCFTVNAKGPEQKKALFFSWTYSLIGPCQIGYTWEIVIVKTI